MNLRELKDRAAKIGATIEDDLANCTIRAKTDTAAIAERYLPLGPAHYSSKRRNQARRDAINNLGRKLSACLLRGGLVLLLSLGGCQASKPRLSVVELPTSHHTEATYHVVH